MRQLLQLLKRFRSDERGAFLVIFGVFAIVLVATAGAVIDFTTIEQARTRAQDALDSAALGLQPTIFDTGVTEDSVEANALLLLNERLGDTNISASIEDVTIDTVAGLLRLEARIDVPTAFVALVGVGSIAANVVAEATRGTGANIEVALVLDVTGSMGMGTGKIETLITATNSLIDTVVKDDQSTAYSKIALVPFSMGVNVGDYFEAETTTSTTIADVRGPEIGATNITGAAWRETASTRTISAINKANPTRITTSTAHGLSTGAVVWISGIGGSSGFTALNNKWYRITTVSGSTTQFRLTGASTSGISGSYTANSGTVTVWPSARMVSSLTEANPGVVTTTAAHGLVDGDAIYITDAAGGSGFTGLNNKWYCVDETSTTTFRLQDESCTNINTTGLSGSYTANSAIIRKCLTPECEIRITSADHGLTTDDYVYVTGVGGMTQINMSGEPNRTATVIDANTFDLEDTDALATSYGTYTSGGTAQCTVPGCRYYYFPSNDTDWNSSTGTWDVDWKMWELNDDCVTERIISPEQYTDAAPATAWAGRLYDSSTTCDLGSPILPLSADKDALQDAVNAFEAEGTTAGHIGLAWGWYMLSPNFASLWPAESTPGAYDDEEVVKVLVFMTDGVFNTAYCNGVLSQDSSFGSGDDKIDCNASNGTPNSQTEALCEAMKAEAVGIEVYTILFDVSDPTIETMLETCATDDDHYYDADNNQDLIDAFAEIGGFLSELRLAE